MSEKPISANQRQEKQNADNPQQLNTYSIKELNNQLYNELTTNDGELRKLYEEYIQMRVNINAPLTSLGLSKLIDRCNRLSKNNVRVQKLLLETAIINNWKNVYLPREEELGSVSAELANDLRAHFGLE